MERNANTHNISTYLFLTLIALAVVPAIYLAFFHQLLYDETFYQQQFKQLSITNNYEAYLVTTEMRELLVYMRDSDKTRINSDFLSDRDKTHMIDVKNIIQTTYTIKYALIVAILILLLASYYLIKLPVTYSIARVCILTGIFLILLTAAAYVLQLAIPLAFPEVFTLFHEVSFDNDLWQLNPEQDNLINLFPELFFKNFLVAIIMQTFYTGLILLTAGIFLPKVVALANVLLKKRQI